jgi:hypothetical protein
MIWDNSGLMRLASLLVALFAGGCDSPEQEPDTGLPDLVLEEITSFRLGVGARVPSRAAYAGNQVVAWSTNSGDVHVFDPTGVQTIALGRTSPLAVSLEGGALRAIEMTPAALVDLEPDQTSAVRRTLSLPGELQSALWTDGAWVVTVLGDSAHLLLSVDHATGRIDVLSELSGPKQVSSWGERLLLADLAPPFELHVREADGSIRLMFRGEAPASGAEGDWVALPALALDDELVLHTLSDLASDRRLLSVLREHQREAVRVREIDVPMAFVSTDPTTRRLLAIRSLNESEIVSYRWSISSN